MTRLTSRWTYIFQASPLIITGFVAYILTLPAGPRDMPKIAVIPLLLAGIATAVWSSLKFCHLIADGDMLHISSLRFTGIIPLEQIKSVWPGSGSRTPYIVVIFEPPLPCGAKLYVLPPSPFWHSYGKEYWEVYRVLTRNNKVGAGSGDQESEVIAAKNYQTFRRFYWALFIVLLVVTGALLVWHVKTTAQ